jgi:hypothetical protein
MKVEMEVYVVTDPELGWGCVVGVYTTLQMAIEEGCGVEYVEGKEHYSYDLPQVIHKMNLKQ